MSKTEPSLKQRLKNGGTAAGVFVAEFNSPNLGTLLGNGGCDFAIIDMEHGAFTLGDLAAMLPSFRPAGCAPLVRVPLVQREFFQPVLDAGAAGIVVPMVEGAGDVRAALSMMRYPPQGRRGVHFSRPHNGFRAPADWGAFTRNANDNLLLVVQIESARGLRNLGAILDEPGADVVFAGNSDLSLSLGEPNDLRKGPVHDAVKTILRAAKKRGLAGGGNFGSPELAGLFKNDGLRFVTLDTEVDMFAAALKNGIEKLRPKLARKNALT